MLKRILRYLFEWDLNVYVDGVDESAIRKLRNNFSISLISYLLIMACLHYQNVIADLWQIFESGASFSSVGWSARVMFLCPIFFFAALLLFVMNLKMLFNLTNQTCGAGYRQGKFLMFLIFFMLSGFLPIFNWGLWFAAGAAFILLILWFDVWRITTIFRNKKRR